MISSPATTESDVQLTKYVAVLTERAKLAKETFLNTDLESFLEKEPIALIAFLHEAYCDLVFFPDDAVIARFVEATGVRPATLRFVALNRVLAELDEITGDGKVQMNKFLVLFLSKVHLDLKINSDLQQWVHFSAPLNGKPYANKAKQLLYGLYRKRRYHAIRPQRPKNLWTEEVNRLLTDVEKVAGDPREAEKYMLAVAGGHADRFFLHGILFTLSETTLHQDAFYRRFYSLFSLLVQDKHFPSESEFHAQTRYYDRSFAAFQAKRVRNLLR